MLKRAFYQLMYPNSFIYIEEYLLFAVMVIILTTVHPLILGIPVAVIAVAATFILVSPRSPLTPMRLLTCSQSATALSESHATTRCALPPALTTHSGELLDEMGRRVYLRGVNVGGKVPLGHTTWTQPPRAGSFVGTLFELDTIERI
jgi:hypothetical protein